LRALDAGEAFHRPRFRRELRAERSGYFVSADCTKIGWAVRRLGAGRERAGEPVDPHAGLAMHVKLGATIEEGQPLVTLFSEGEARFAEPERLLRDALQIGEQPVAPLPLVRQVVSADDEDSFLKAPPSP
jgi:pyrimidine-nucleoside phosphorylase